LYAEAIEHKEVQKRYGAIKKGFPKAVWSKHWWAAVARWLCFKCGG
jgi:hypothetical protein